MIFLQQFLSENSDHLPQSYLNTTSKKARVNIVCLICEIYRFGIDKVAVKASSVRFVAWMVYSTPFILAKIRDIIDFVQDKFAFTGNLTLY